MSFSLRLFGGASIEGPEGPLTGRAAQRHRLALLAMLAASARSGITRDRLIAYLWPDSDDERARRSLSDSIYRINRALGDDTLRTAGDEVRLDADRLPSDVAAFRTALEAEDWERAAGLYVGPFLDGFHLPGAGEFERWLDAQRDELGRRYASALEALAAERTEAGDLAGAVAAWRRRAAHDRYDARVAMRLMEALDAAGNRAGALQHARIHAQLLEEEFGAAPNADVTALAERLRARPKVPAPTPGASATTTPAAAPTPGATPTPAPSDDPPPSEPEPPPPEREPPPPGHAAGAAPAHPLGRRVAAGSLLVLLALAAGLAVWFSRDGSDATATAVPTVAVLPFENLDADDRTLYFAHGVTEDVVTNLSRVPDLRIVASASPAGDDMRDRSPREIADELGVDYLLRGTIRRVDEDVRVTAQLIDARTTTNVWAQAYDRRLEDIFAVQSDIARRVADALETELGATVAARIDRPPTEDLAAYNLYLRGRYLWHARTEASLRESAELFEQAVERDPEYARAWAGLADAYAVLAFYDYLPPDEAYPKARQAANRALAIDDALAEAHASLGYIRLYYDWDAPSAEVSFRRAIELNPSYSVAHQWYANLLVATGRFQEAEREMGRAREVNPLSLIANAAQGWVYYYAGRYEDAVHQCDLALEMDPAWDLGHMWRGMALERMGRTSDALAALEAAVELSGGSGISVAALAHARASAGDHDGARAMLRRLEAATRRGDYQPAFEIAKVHVALGDPEEALRWLERAFDERSHSMVFLRVDPQLADLAGYTDFRRLAERVGLLD